MVDLSATSHGLSRRQTLAVLMPLVAGHYSVYAQTELTDLARHINNLARTLAHSAREQQQAIAELIHGEKPAMDFKFYGM